MGKAATRRTRRHRRTRRQVQRHGRAAKRPHVRLHGRSGRIHTKMTPSAQPAALHSSASSPATSAILFAVRIVRIVRIGLDEPLRRLHAGPVTSSH